jgi:aminoglycoside phosphotransferase (APT) family kinase protein
MPDEPTDEPTDALPGGQPDGEADLPIDLARLGAWMDDEGLPRGPFVDVELLSGGTQNILLRFERGGERYVLRHPPAHKRKNSDDTMRREARVLAALAETDVPHPRLLAACGDDEVLGAAFYLMEPIDGFTPNAATLPEPYASSAEWRHAMGLSMADGAAAVGAVDHVAVGLADLGHAEGYLERQVGRWRSQLESYSELDGYPGPDIPGVEEVGDWLDANRPTDWRPGLIHGDYHLSNSMFRHDRPELAAIVDWELSTIGDPLLDLGWMLATWPRAGVEAGTVGAGIEDLPTPDELVGRYAERSNRDLSPIAWYEVLACYKLGLILEGTYARACAGLAPKETGDRLHASTVGLFRHGVDRIHAG